MIDVLLHKALEYIKKKRIDEKGVHRLIVIKKDNYYNIECGPDGMTHMEISDLIYYAVKFLADKFDLSVTETMYSLIPLFKHIESGRDLDEIASEYVAEHVASVANKVKIDA